MGTRRLRRMKMAQGKLGFSFMRLPVIDGVQENIDLEQLNQMVDFKDRTDVSYDGL
jgi:hypothetical protein